MDSIQLEIESDDSSIDLKTKNQVNQKLSKLHSKLFKTSSIKKPKRTLIDLVTNGHQSSESSLSVDNRWKRRESGMKKGEGAEVVEPGEDEVGDDWFGEQEFTKDIIRVRVGKKIKKLLKGGTNAGELNRARSRIIAQLNYGFSSVESLSSQLDSPTIITADGRPIITLDTTTSLFTPITSISSNQSDSSATGSRTPTRTLTLKNTTLKLPSRRNRLASPLTKLKSIISNSSASSISEVDEEEKFVFEVLYEHQRGAFFFAKARFSGAALNQLDPAAWTDGKQRDSPFTLNNFPLPSLFHQWTTNWLVDMGGDVDESGWSYSYLFHSNYWRGKPNMLFSFVRRRRWIRGRMYTPPSKPVTSSKSIVVEWSPSPPNLTPSDGSQIGNSINSGPLPTSPTGLKAACALLPLEPKKKSEIFNWSLIELQARNPFLSYEWVKREGAGTILKIEEERIRLRLERKESGIDPDQGGSGIERSEDLLMGVWKDAVMEINYRRISRVLKNVCRVDREKLELWEWWMGRGGKEIKLPECACRTLKKGKGKLRTGGERGSKMKEKPDIEDVWTLVEGRLDQILAQFEFQSSRLTFLHLILSSHPTSHSRHNFKGIDVDRKLPEILDSAGVGSMFKRKLDFWADVEALRKAYGE